MRSFRFIHTGDIHLDSPLKGLSGQQGAAAERIRTATRVALDNLVGQAIEDEVDFVVIAGDLYDGNWRDYQTGLFFARQMGRLAQAEIPVFLLHGNHDAESQITSKLSLPPNVSVFSPRKAQTFRPPNLDVALHGQSFRHRDITDNLVPAYPAPIAGCFNIGVLHTGLGEMHGDPNYAPCALEDLINKGYNYWALGHVHQAAVLHERPHVVFCGNLQGRHIRESGSKGASLVVVEDGEAVLSQCPQVIVHTNYADKPFILKQLVWLRLECSHDGSIKSVALDFFAQVDRLLGTNYTQNYNVSRLTEDVLAQYVARVAALHELGALIIDDVHRLSLNIGAALCQRA